MLTLIGSDEIIQSHFLLKNNMKKTILGSVLALGVVVGGFFLYSSSDSINWLASMMEGDKRTQVESFEGELVTFETNFGDIKIKLYREGVPNISKNFVALAKREKYDGTIFHRVIDGFMIQGGDFENFNGTGGTSYLGTYLKDEFSEEYSHVRGVISMANKGPDTNGSQFFIVQKDATFLDGRHSVFGEVVEGMDVVDKISGLSTDEYDAPIERVVIKEVEVE